MSLRAPHAHLARVVLPVLLALCAGAACAEPVLARVEIGWEVFQLEVAADPASRARGLMGRTEIRESGGMLFVFPESAPRSFWMKNCLVDMDLAYLDGAGRVVAIHTMTAPPTRLERESERAYDARLRRYPSGAPVRYAIELRAGTLSRLGIAPGARLDLSSAPRAR